MLMVVSTNGVDTVMGTSLLTWTSATAGTAVNGTTSTNADTPGHGNFITDILTTLTIGGHHRAVLYGKERQLQTTLAQRVTEYHQKQS